MRAVPLRSWIPLWGLLALALVALLGVAGCGGSTHVTTTSTSAPARGFAGGASTGATPSTVRAKLASGNGLLIVDNKSGNTSCTVDGYAQPFSARAQESLYVAPNYSRQPPVINSVQCLYPTRRLDGLGIGPNTPNLTVVRTGDSLNRTDQTPVGLHLRMRLASRSGWGPDCTGDWAQGTGYCDGSFISQGGTTPPFVSGASGKSSWSPGTLVGVTGTLITTRVTSEPDFGKVVKCVIRDRSRGECYTAPGQPDAMVGKPGGPLSIDAHAAPSVCAGSGCEIYIHIQGFCPKDSPNCSL